MEGEQELPGVSAEEIAKEGFYLVNSLLHHRYRQGSMLVGTGWKNLNSQEIPTHITMHTSKPRQILVFSGSRW